MDIIKQTLLAIDFVEDDILQLSVDNSIGSKLFILWLVNKNHSYEDEIGDYKDDHSKKNESPKPITDGSKERTVEHFEAFTSTQ